MVYWASILAALCWLYVVFASFWPLLFARDFVKASERVDQGYRIGLWKIHWRLPRRAAILVVLLSLVPILTVIFIDNWLVSVIVAFVTCIILILWMVASPGMILGSKLARPEGDAPVLRHTSQGISSRSVLVFLVFGLAPGIAIGGVLRWVLITFVISAK